MVGICWRRFGSDDGVAVMGGASRRMRQYGILQHYVEIIMNTTNHYPHPYALRPIKPPPWRHRFPPLALLYHPPIISILLLLSNKLNPSTSTSFRLRPKHSSVNTHSQNPTNPTAFDRPWPDSLRKNYQQSSTTLINNSPHSTTLSTYRGP